MKHCSHCQRDYSDDTLSFCLDDGSRLIGGPEPQTQIFPGGKTTEPPTVVFEPGYLRSVGGAYQENAISIAVLPFVNVSNDPDNEYFCDGLAEELLNALSRIETLRVAARSSAFFFKGKEIGIDSIGRALGVKTILEGSVRKSGNRVRINLQLVKVADGYQLWSEQFDREMQDIFEVQDEIGRAVVDALKPKFQGGGPDGVANNHSTFNKEAYELYLRGRFFLNKFTPENFNRAVDCFNSAIAFDPTYALAYAGLADAYVMLSEMGPMAADEGMPKARDMAEKALSLDEALAEAHCSLGLVCQDYEYDHRAAERQYTRAIELNAGNPVAHQLYGHLLAQLGKHPEAELQFKKALDVDPLSVVGNWIYSHGLFEARNYDASIKQADKALELDINFPAAYLTLAFAYQMKGDYEASVNEYARFSGIMGNPHIAALIKQSFSDGGWQGFLQAMTRGSRPAELSSYIIAAFHTALGERAEAFAELEKSYAAREPYLVILNVDPRMDPLREDPRFADLLGRLGFSR